MAINPCIADSDCVSLAVDVDSNLVASLVISADVGNCLECRADGAFSACAEVDPCACNAIEEHAGGLWVPQVSQGFAQIGPSSGAPYIDQTVAGPLTPAGEIIARSGSVSITAPTCGDGILLRAELIGPVQVTDISAGGRFITGYQSRILPNPYAGGPYAVYRNSGTSLGEIGYPVTTTTPVISTIAAGATETLEWKQTYEITAGSVGSIIFRGLFIYLWCVNIAEYSCGSA